MKHTLKDWLANTALLIAIIAPLTLAFVKTLEQARSKRTGADMSDSGIYAWHVAAYGEYGRCAMLEWSRGE
jgi:hypothetical protein